MIKGQSVNPITKNDLNLIFDYLKRKDLIVILAIVKTALNTGLRISDILNLTFEDLDNPTLKEKKTQRRKIVTFNSGCTENFSLLKAYYKKKKIKNFDTGFIFKSLIRPDSHITYQGVNFYMKQIREDLNIEYPFNTHSFRKTWARTVYFQFNNDLALVMKALNHTNPAVTLRYIGIDNDDLNKVYTDIIF